MCRNCPPAAFVVLETEQYSFVICCAQITRLTLTPPKKFFLPLGAASSERNGTGDGRGEPIINPSIVRAFVRACVHLFVRVRESHRPLMLAVARRRSQNSSVSYLRLVVARGVGGVGGGAHTRRKQARCCGTGSGSGGGGAAVGTDKGGGGAHLYPRKNAMKERKQYGDAPPAEMLKELNDELRDRFKREISVVAARVNKLRVNNCVRQMSSFPKKRGAANVDTGVPAACADLLLRLPKVKSVIEERASKSDDRLVLLAQHVSIRPDAEAVESLGETRTFPIDALVGASDSEMALLQEYSKRVQHHTVTLGYKDCTVDQILRELLPAHLIAAEGNDASDGDRNASGDGDNNDDGDENANGMPRRQNVPSSFETVGHIAHINLRDEFLPYKRLICEVILDKNWPGIRTVVNKTGNITNEFRCLPLEIVAGLEKTETTVREGGALFSLDYATVYWNSRLETEHRRLVDRFSADDVVADVMAGIGPFAVPSALKGCSVYANDLNPASYESLRHNTRINKVAHKVSCSCVDGRAFMRHVLSSHLSTATTSAGDDAGAGEAAQLPLLSRPATRLVMNLPATAVEFLDCVADAMKSYNDAGSHRGRDDSSTNSLPFIHVYTFVRPSADDPPLPPGAAAKAGALTASVKAAVEQHLGCAINPVRDEFHVHIVRDVAPKKLMACVSFRIPLELLPGEDVGAGPGQLEKRPRIS